MVIPYGAKSGPVVQLLLKRILTECLLKETESAYLPNFTWIGQGCQEGSPSADRNGHLSINEMN